MSHEVKSPEPIFDKIFLGTLGFFGGVAGFLKKLTVFAIFFGIVGYIIVVAREEFKVEYFFKPNDLGEKIEKGR